MSLWLLAGALAFKLGAVAASEYSKDICGLGLARGHFQQQLRILHQDRYIDKPFSAIDALYLDEDRS